MDFFNASNAKCVFLFLLHFWPTFDECMWRLCSQCPFLQAQDLRYKLHHIFQVAGWRKKFNSTNHRRCPAWTTDGAFIPCTCLCLSELRHLSLKMWKGLWMEFMCSTSGFFRERGISAPKRDSVCPLGTQAGDSVHQSCLGGPHKIECLCLDEQHSWFYERKKSQSSWDWYFLRWGLFPV